MTERWTENYGLFKKAIIEKLRFSPDEITFDEHEKLKSDEKLNFLHKQVIVNGHKES